MNRHLDSIGKFLIQDRSLRRLVFIDWRLNRQNNKCSFRKHISKSLNIFAYLGKKVLMTKGRGDIKHCKNLRKNRQKAYKNQGLELLAGANLLQTRPLRSSPYKKRSNTIFKRRMQKNYPSLNSKKIKQKLNCVDSVSCWSPVGLRNKNNFLSSANLNNILP